MGLVFAGSKSLGEGQWARRTARLCSARSGSMLGVDQGSRNGWAGVWINGRWWVKVLREQKGHGLWGLSPGGKSKGVLRMVGVRPI